MMSGLTKESSARSGTDVSLSVMGFGGPKVLTLSSGCSVGVMPLGATATSGMEATRRNARDARLSPASSPGNKTADFLVSLARRLPSNGSMTMRGMSVRVILSDIRRGFARAANRAEGRAGGRNSL